MALIPQSDSVCGVGAFLIFKEFTPNQETSMKYLKTSERAAAPRRRFLKRFAAGIAATALLMNGNVSVFAETAGLEKEDLKFGFIKLTDMAPLAIAYEKGYFEDEGLYVTLEAQANWKVLLDRVIDGELDGAHMLAGQPLGATIGFGTKADIITAFSMDLNGNGYHCIQQHLETDESKYSARRR